MPQMVEARRKFFDRKKKVQRVAGQRWVMPNPQARNLALLGFVVIVEGLEIIDSYIPKK